jgi:hypothetical protein
MSFRIYHSVSWIGASFATLACHSLFLTPLLSGEVGSFNGRHLQLEIGGTLFRSWGLSTSIFKAAKSTWLGFCIFDFDRDIDSTPVASEDSQYEARSPDNGVFGPRLTESDWGTLSHCRLQPLCIWNFLLTERSCEVSQRGSQPFPFQRGNWLLEQSYILRHRLMSISHISAWCGALGEMLGNLHRHEWVLIMCSRMSEWSEWPWANVRF